MERSISLIMPAFNEGYYIEEAVKTVLAKLKDHDFDYEIFIFDDASTDETGRIADSFALEDPKIKVFHNHRNMNLGYNFSRGIGLASKTFTGLLPCHNLIAPESYDMILSAAERTQKDIIITHIANPWVRPHHRRFVSWINTWLLNLIFGFKFKYYHLNFYRTALLKQLPNSTQSYALMVELLVWALYSGASYVEVPFWRKERSTGKSKALRIKNIADILKTYARLFWRVRILGEKISLK